MQWLASICVRRPVFTWVLILSFTVVGFASMLGLGVNRFPNIDFPMVVVTTTLPGAAPEQVETEVTDKIEESVNSISGLDELRSRSYEGLSVVMARFDLDKSTTVAAQEVRDHVNRTIPTLPSDIDQPVVARMDPDAAPVMLVALTGRGTIRETTEFADKDIKRRIESLAGVGGVTILGGQQRQVNVVVDPMTLQSLGLTVVDVQRALATQNVEIPGGRIDQGARTFQLRVQGRVQTVSEFNDLTVARRGDRIIRLGDVAKVEDGQADLDSAAVYDGRRVVILGIRKQSGTNTVAVVDGHARPVAELQRPCRPATRSTSCATTRVRSATPSQQVVESTSMLGAAAAPPSSCCSSSAACARPSSPRSRSRCRSSRRSR